MGLICFLLFAYWIVLLARVIASWIPIPPSGPIRAVLDVVFTVTEPVLALVRGLLPPVRMGAVGFDLSPLLVFIVLGVLQRVLC